MPGAGRGGGGAVMARGGGGGAMMARGGGGFRPGGAVIGRGIAPRAAIAPAMRAPIHAAAIAPAMRAPVRAAPLAPAMRAPIRAAALAPKALPPVAPGMKPKKPPFPFPKKFPKGGFFAPPSWWWGGWGPWWWWGGYPYVEEYLVPVATPTDCGSFVAERDGAAGAAPDAARMALREARAGQHKPRCPTACAPVLENLGGTWALVYYTPAGSTCPAAPGDNFMGIPVVYTAFQPAGLYGFGEDVPEPVAGVMEFLGPVGVIAILAGIALWATIRFGPKIPDVPPEYVLAGGRRRSARA